MNQKNKKIEPAFQNATKAIQSLRSFLSMPVKNDRDRAGVIQAFEYCYETIWKLLQKIAEEQGMSVQTPKQAFNCSFSMGFIVDEKIWLEMIESRNLTSHAYKEELAEQIFDKIKNTYISEFEKHILKIKKFLD